jgi:hypothetical protein
MPINKVDGVWAETGTREPTLSDAKKATGFVGGDAPPIERFNEIIGRGDDKLDEIIRERLNSAYDGATDIAKMMTTGIWSDGWAIAGEAPNAISSGGTKEIRDIAAFFTAAGLPRLLLADNANLKFEVWDPRSLTLLSTSDAMTDDLDTSGTQVWEFVSMCTDGTNVYATFKDTNATPDTHAIQAWNISTWDIVTGWGATGTALAGTGNGPIAAKFRDSKVIIADDDHVAVSCGWVDITAAGDGAIQLFDRTDGSAVRDGAGDATTGASYYPCEGIASDGTDIFFIITKASSTKICTATIADLTAGTGGTAYPYELTTVASGGARLCNIGSELIASVVMDYPGDAVEVLNIHNSSAAARGGMMRGRDSSAGPVSGDAIVMNDGCWGMCFDGLSLWCLNDIDITGAADVMSAVRTDVGQMPYGTSIDRQWTDISTTIPLVQDSAIYEGVYLSICCDGRDIWATVDPQSGNTHSGKIYRVPLALIRSV